LSVACKHHKSCRRIPFPHPTACTIPFASHGAITCWTRVRVHFIARGSGSVIPFCRQGPNRDRPHGQRLAGLAHDVHGHARQLASGEVRGCGRSAWGEAAARGGSPVSPPRSRRARRGAGQPAAPSGQVACGYRHAFGAGSPGSGRACRGVAARPARADFLVVAVAT
jgi:hypothetical protein